MCARELYASVEKFGWVSSARTGGETCAHQLSGIDVLGWCVDELFRCVRVILAGGEIRASGVTLYFTSCCEIRRYKFGWRNSGWTTMKVMCVFGCLKLDWSFTTCVAVGWMLPGISCLKNVVLSSLEINELCWIVWYGNVCGLKSL